MTLDSVTLKNFRCYLNETTMTFGSLTTLIGKNDVGKSAALEALEIFFNNSLVAIESADCHIKAPDPVIEISCEFSNLPLQIVLDSSVQTSLAAEYLLTQRKTLKIKKKYKTGAGKVKEEVFICAHHPSATSYDDLLGLTQRDLGKRIKDLSISSATINLNVNSEMRSAIWASSANLQLVEREIDVTKGDTKTIWEKLKEFLPLFALFQSDRASKDSDAEVQDPMKLAIQSALAEPAVRQKLDDVTNAVRTSAEDLANRTHKVIEKIDSNLASQLTPQFKADPKWAGLFSMTLNSDGGIPVNKRGSGVRRMILVGFFRAEAERRIATGNFGGIIYAIEEPETSQHPNNQKLLLESFEDLSSEAGCQVILSTHSPNFANFLPLDGFRFIDRDASGHPVVKSGQTTTWEEMVKTLGVIPDNRVKVLICVEGPTDVDDLRCLSKALHDADMTLPDLGNDPRVAFVVLGGGSLTHWVSKHYLSGLGRPECHIYDNDVATYGAAVTRVNARGDGSWGQLTQKREIENYLHPDAIQSGLGVTITVTDDCNVPDLVGPALTPPLNPNNTKKRLAKFAFPKMTAALLRQRDPANEVEGWLRAIAAKL
jgi:putative ATP-dependent endonuclease of OLD family